MAFEHSYKPENHLRLYPIPIWQRNRDYAFQDVVSRDEVPFYEAASERVNTVKGVGFTAVGVSPSRHYGYFDEGDVLPDDKVKVIISGGWQYSKHHSLSDFWEAVEAVRELGTETHDKQAGA